jgi:hypothetical protein
MNTCSISLTVENNPCWQSHSSQKILVRFSSRRNLVKHMIKHLLNDTEWERGWKPIVRKGNLGPGALSDIADTERRRSDLRTELRSRNCEKIFGNECLGYCSECEKISLLGLDELYARLAVEACIRAIKVPRYACYRDRRSGDNFIDFLFIDEKNLSAAYGCYCESVGIITCYYPNGKSPWKRPAEIIDRKQRELRARSRVTFVDDRTWLRGSLTTNLGVLLSEVLGRDHESP